MRALLLLLPLAGIGCKQATEIVLRLEAPAAAPPLITVALSRSTSFDSDPQTPPFVVAALDGPNLDLLVTPQGKETVISLLPPPNGPNDLTAAASAAGYMVMPDGPQPTMFVDGSSVSLLFTFTPLPTGDMATPRDLAAPRDMAAGDALPGG